MRRKRNIYLITLIMVMAMVSSIGYAALSQDLSISGDIAYEKKEPVICKRATTLLTETCDRSSDGCYAAGYYASGTKGTTTITYGSLGVDDTTLTSGDAFDCDVNGDGTYDPETERFYYVSGLDGDNNSEYATLVYYTNVSAGNNNNIAISYYHSEQVNNNGPTISFQQLPSIVQWSNVSLSTQTRQIYSNTNTTSTTAGALPQFTYTDKAARLLSHKEVNAACGITIGNFPIGELDSCEYLLEHTYYSTDNSNVNAGYWWLESPEASDSSYVWHVSGRFRLVSHGYANVGAGVRPAIEVKKSQMDLKIPPKKCRRATELHTEICDRTSKGCYDTGYSASGSKGTTTITYGSLGTNGTLTSGDAFDCDVNGDGTYDAETERFYYVSGLDGNENSDYATLIYYTNVSAGVPNNTATFPYDSSDYNFNGPVDAYEQLPSTALWKNVSLFKQIRQIYAENGQPTTDYGGYSIEEFTYTNRAARLLDYREVNKACGITIGRIPTGELDKCEFLLEHTGYSTNDSSVNKGYWWLESPVSSQAYDVWNIFGEYRRVDMSSPSSDSVRGVRPAIEVLKTDIDY